MLIHFKIYGAKKIFAVPMVKPGIKTG